VDKQYYIFWECVCSVRYRACSEHAPYEAVRLYNIRPHYLTKGTIFGKKLLNISCVFRYYLQLSSEIFLTLRRTERDMIKNL
jgi:hypothetical protein